MTDSLPKGRLDELEALAGKATPGPWHWYESSRELLAPFAEVVFGPDDDPEESDGEFIAALDPDTVRALIARVREAEAKIEQVRAILDDEPECAEHPDSDPVTCGWKYDIRRIRGVMEEASNE